VEGRATAQRQMHALIVASPEAIRARFRGATSRQAVLRAARLRTSPNADTETAIAVRVLRSLARRALDLEAETKGHERELERLVRRWRPELLEKPGVGPVVAATVLCAWSHSGRFRSDAAFASLAGACPVPASSGQIVRHRLNRRGDRQLNRALHIVVINRLRCDAQTRAYAARRRAEGKTEREIKRCLKRYVARELYRHLESSEGGLDGL